MSAFLASRFLVGATEKGDEIGPEGVITRGDMDTVSGCAVWSSNFYIEQVIRFGAQRRKLGWKNYLGCD